MKLQYCCCSIFVSILTVFTLVQNASAQIKVVTTLSSYADIARNVGGELVEVTSIASPRFDPHFIEPKPSDVLKLKRADLFVHSGLDLEAWREPLVDAAARSDIRSKGERQLDLSVKIPILDVPTNSVSRAEGDIHLFGNPHYWLDPRNGIIIAEEIAAKLCQLDPTNGALYQQKLSQYRAKLEEKIKTWQGMLEQYRGTRLVGYHDGWVYLMSFSGMTMDLFLEPKPGIPPTPKQIESIVSAIKAEHIPAIIHSVHNSKDAAEDVKAKTETKIITLSQGVGDLPEASDYISVFDYDVKQLMEAVEHD